MAALSRSYWESRRPLPDTDCLICYEPLRGECVGHQATAAVSHVFHERCYEMWARAQLSARGRQPGRVECPMCREHASTFGFEGPYFVKDMIVTCLGLGVVAISMIYEIEQARNGSGEECRDFELGRTLAIAVISCLVITYLCKKIKDRQGIL